MPSNHTGLKHAWSPGNKDYTKHQEGFGWLALITVQLPALTVKGQTHVTFHRFGLFACSDVIGKLIE